MALYSCGNCGNPVEAQDDSFGVAVICGKCGFLVQIGQDEKPPREKVSVPKTSTATPDRRGIIVLACLYGLFLLFLPIALISARSSSPLCLTAFSVNLALGTAGGFLFLTGLNNPDYLTDWLNMEFTRWKAAQAFLPLFVLGLVVAYFTFSP